MPNTILSNTMAMMHRYSLEMMVIGVIVGILFPTFMNTYVFPMLSVTIFIVMVCTFIQVDFSQVAHGFKNRAPWINAIWNTLILTVLVFVVLSAFDTPYEVKLALVALAASAPILAASTVAQMLGLQAYTVLLTTMTSTLLMPLSLYFAIFILLDSPLQLDLQSYAIRFMIYLICPAIIGYTIQKYTRPVILGRIRHTSKNIAVLLTILFIFGIMGDYGLLLRHDRDWALSLLGYNIIFVGLITLSTYWVYGVMSDRETALTYASATTTRNSFLAWIVAGPYLGGELLSLIGTAQITMIVVMIGVKMSQKSAKNKMSGL